jgi:hypothetical protein
MAPFFTGADIVTAIQIKYRSVRGTGSRQDCQRRDNPESQREFRHFPFLSCAALSGQWEFNRQEFRRVA